MILLEHPAKLVRFVSLRHLGMGQWQATFREGGLLMFQTEIGSRFLVLDAVRNNFLYAGLPLIEEAFLPPEPRGSAA